MKHFAMNLSYEFSVDLKAQVVTVYVSYLLVSVTPDF